MQGGTRTERPGGLSLTFRALLCGGLCVLLTTGCGRARANTIPSLPPLEVPAPPPRVLIPVEVVAEGREPEPVQEEPLQTPAPTPPPRPAPPATPVPPPKVAEEQPKPPLPGPPTALQTTPPAVQGEAEKAIRTTMVRASGDLSKVDYRALTAGARNQYDTAKRFIEQAEDAIRLKNLLFAKNLADKAAVLAAELLGQ
jgi:type IV secretory pathway VirB10-like protein